MIDHATIDDAIEAWITNMGLQAYYRDKEEPTTRMQSSVAGQITQAIASWKFLASHNPGGQDEVRYSENSGDNTLQDRVVTGPRVFTVSVQVKSIRHNAPNHAFGLAERLRTRLRLPSQTILFRNAKIALADSEDVIDLSFKDKNGRTIGLAGFDVRFNVAANESDATGDTIKTIELTTEFKDEVGVLLPSEHQLTEFPLVVDP